MCSTGQLVGLEPPYPAPRGTEWCFECPVGVDCSSPEPRCIWLAVLRSVCTAAAPTDPPRWAKGRRDGISSSEKPRMAARESMPWRGPRTLFLRKNSQGFGFTLRHFIVYPPESSLHPSLLDEENGNGKGFDQSRLEPMDTIFVKSVRERGPAHQAGLCTGDRLVKVNGRSVLGMTYSEVIALIQSSENFLELSIMPKDEDVLQLAYSQDAYLRGNEPYTGEARDLPEPPPLCYPSSTPPHPPPYAGPPVGHNQLDNWNRWPGSGHASPLDNRPIGGSPTRDPGGVSLTSPAHHTEEIQYGMTGKKKATGQTRGRPGSVAPRDYADLNAGAGQQSRVNRRCQQALADWYHSQVPERAGPAHSRPSSRHRSYSQDRLSEGRGRLSVGWPHSASQDTLLLPPQPPIPSPAPVLHDPAWAGLRASRARSENQLAAAKYERSRSVGRSLEMLDCTAYPAERVGRQHQRAPPPLPRPEALKRADTYYGAAPPPGGRQARPRLPPRRAPAQAPEEQLGGYRSYSPSFQRKAGRLLQAQSFRDPFHDPSSSGSPHSWTPSPKPSPPDPAPVPRSAAPLHSAPFEPQDGSRRLTNHERPGSAPEVSVRQKPPTGRRSAHPHRPPLAILPPDVADSSAPFTRDHAPRRHNGGLAHLPLEDDSLATIPFIGSREDVFDSDEQTSPSVDAHACYVPASSVVNSDLSSAPTLPPFSFPPSKPFAKDYSNLKFSRRSSYMLAITTERSKSCDEGLNTFSDEGRVFSKLPKRVKSFLTDGSLDSLATEDESLSKRHSTSELGNLTFSDVLKEGWLHYKQIVTEKGKKVGSAMRPWKRAYSVLRSHLLFLYKDKREALLHRAGVGEAEEEQPISISGCLVDIAYSETKRKHALRLTTQDTCEYLLQAEDQKDMLSWIEVIRENSKNDSEDLGVCGQALISKKLNDYRKQSPTGSKPDTSPKAARMMPSFHLAKPDSAVSAPRSPKSERKEENSPPKAPWGINIMKKPKKAGPKAFGVRLEDCQPSVNNKFVPQIVEICCGLVEEMGLEYTGIYRVPGNNAMVSSLQEQLNKGVDINPTEERWQDLNVVSSLLKSFFRKLQEPLFTNDKYNDFIDANRMENAGDRLKTMKKLMHDLPDCNYHTLKFLVGHLKTVADHSEKNKMEPRNLALVFGPTLVRTSDDNMTDMVTHMPDRYKIVETLIQHYDWFFSEDLDKDEKTPVDTADLQPVPNIDHLLSNIGRTGMPGEISDSTTSDSAKSKGSWGSKKDLSAKDFLALSIISAVTRKRKKRLDNRVLSSSTDEDSEQEPIRAAEIGEEEEEGEGGGGLAPRAEGEVEDEDDGEEEEAERTVEEVMLPRRPCEEEVEREAEGEAFLLQDEAEVGGSGRGREVGEEPRTSALSFRDTPPSPHWGGAGGTRQTTSAASWSGRRNRPCPHAASCTHTPNPRAPARVSPLRGPSSTCRRWIQGTGAKTGPGAPRPPPRPTPPRPPFALARPSFCSRRLIQGDTLARKKVKEAKARSLDLDLELEDEGPDRAPIGAPHCQLDLPPRTLADAGPACPPPDTEAASFSPSAHVFREGQASLAEQVRARLMGSADDLRAVGHRPAVSPETRRKRRAWRRHTVVVDVSGQGGHAPSEDKPAWPRNPEPPSQSEPREHAALSVRPTPPSRFHEYL
ncbi:hypothetical protein GJAV_G00216570 [Gymnothorax javanicus]|nr:hypothetical protein GJAV_G00216570 [Gymnothorax javanicus]